MTLNTFHFAGVGEKSNVTRGVPRIKELFNITKAPKNPSLTVFPKITVGSDESPDVHAVEIKSKESAKRLMDLMEITTLGSLVTKSSIFYRFTPESMHHQIFHYLRALCHRVRDAPSAGGEAGEGGEEGEETWILLLELNKKKMVEKDITMEEVGEAMRRCCPNDFVISPTDESLETPCIYITIDTESSTSIKVEDESDRFNILKLLERYLLDKVFLRGVPDLKKISLFQVASDGFYDDKGAFVTPQSWVLDSMGSNLIDALAHPGVDHRNTVSNNIYQIYETLGIEAARNALFTEIDGVIRQENSYVNVRHIGVLADAMTSRGTLMSVDRHGINRGEIGPLAKCSFEETDQMLYKAAVFGELDNVKGVSSNIMLGQVPPCGTGFVDILLDEDEYGEIYKDTEWSKYLDRHKRSLNSIRNGGCANRWTTTTTTTPPTEDDHDHDHDHDLDLEEDGIDFGFNPDL
jgi:DNA-directed RNA polymerase II subunit RPB1